MAQFSVRLFGHPQILIGDQAVEVDTRKAVALLAFLALSGQSHSRDALAGFFWPDYDHSNARAALRRTLSTLNKAIGSESIESDWEKIALKVSADFWLDVLAFKAHLAATTRHGHAAEETCPACINELQAAVTLASGEFMEGFSLRDSAPFDEWQFFQREELARALAGALERLSGLLAQSGQYEQAIEQARRWLALDGLREEAHRQLMRLYALAGQHSAAIRQYRECARVLEEELGARPSAETTRLYQEISERQLGPASRPGPAAVSAPRPALEPAALVGRAREWGLLNQAFERHEEHFIALVGEAGIGKTYLAEAFAAAAREKGAVVLSGRCYEGEREIAYGPLLQAVRPRLGLPQTTAALLALPSPWLAETAWLLPELAALVTQGHTGASGILQAQHPAEGHQAQSRFFEGLRQVLLAARGSGAAGVLLIDNLHLADSATLDFLTYLVRRIQGQGLLLVGTWVEDGSPAAAQLKRLLAEAERGGVGLRLRLRRLNAAEVAVLAGEQSALPAELSAQLQNEAEGLPYFVVEYLSAIKEGKVRGNDGPWGLPHGVRDLLHTRLAGISEPERLLLGAAAVIGRSFDFDTLLQASSRGEEELVSSLEQLLARGLIREQRHAQVPGAVRYDFSHEKLRALVYEETSLARRRLWHRRVAEALSAQVEDPQTAGMQASTIARHFQLAGQPARAAEYFNIAGQHARRLHANTEAVLHFQAALACGYPNAAELHEAIGDLQTLLGRYSEALASYQAVAGQMAPECPAQIEYKLGKVHFRRGDWEQTQVHFSAALASQLAAGDASLRARITADWSQAEAKRGQIERALELARQSQQQAAVAGDQLALAQSENILGILARTTGQPAQARRHLQLSLEAAQQAQDASAQIAALNNLALVSGDLNEIEEAIGLAQAALRLCMESGDRHYEAALRGHLADYYHAAGQAEPAMEQLGQAVKIFAEVGIENGQARPEIWKLSEW